MKIASYFHFKLDRSCPDPPPEPWLGIDVDWPKKSSTRGSVLTYTCPYKKMTYIEQITGMLCLD